MRWHQPNQPSMSFNYCVRAYSDCALFLLLLLFWLWFMCRFAIYVLTARRPTHIRCVSVCVCNVFEYFVQSHRFGVAECARSMDFIVFAVCACTLSAIH